MLTWHVVLTVLTFDVQIVRNGYVETPPSSIAIGLHVQLDAISGLAAAGADVARYVLFIVLGHGSSRATSW